MDINKVIFKVVKWTFSLMVLLLAVYGTLHISLITFDFGYRVFTESAIDEEPGTVVEVTIEKGMGSAEIGALLYQKGLVRDANLFVLQHKLSAYADDVLPGTYLLNTAMTPKDMMITLSDETQQIVEETESAEGSETAEE